MATEEIKTKCKKHHKTPLNFSFDFAGSKSREWTLQSIFLYQREWTPQSIFLQQRV